MLSAFGFMPEDEWVLRFCVPYSRVRQFLIDNRIHRRWFRMWIEPFAVSPNADLLFIDNDIYPLVKATTLEATTSTPSLEIFLIRCIS